MRETFTSPESTNIYGAEYDMESRDLLVSFRSKARSGLVASVYRYSEVPVGIWIGFRDAASKGAFFASCIKPQFQGAKQ